MFLVSSTTPQGVLESQVVKIANYLSIEYSFNVKIVFVDTIIDNLIVNNGVKVCCLGKDISIKEIQNSKVYIRRFDIYMRYFLKLKYFKNTITYDFRALVFAESFYRNKKYSNSAVIFICELICYLTADYISTVSYSLRKKMFSFFLFKRKVYVFPCMVIQKEFKSSAVNKDDGQLNFVYMGGLSKWQKFDLTLSLFSIINSKIDNDCKLTIITKDISEARSILNEKNMEANVISLSNDEVMKELSNHHFGFLLRDNVLINNVASPIKYFEYLIADVIPIMSIGIGDYSTEAKQNDIALVLNNNKEINELEIIRLINDKLIYKRTTTYLESYNIKEKLKNHPLVVR